MELGRHLDFTNFTLFLEAILIFFGHFVLMQIFQDPQMVYYSDDYNTMWPNFTFFYPQPSLYMAVLTFF